MTDMTMTVPREPSDGPAEVVQYGGRAGALAGIALTNSLLTLATLGIYRFWGKTRLRRYLWSRITYQGDSLEYSGTGMELFIGFLVAIAILSPLVGASVAVDIYYAADLELLAIKGFVQAFIILYLIQIAIYRARRYRLTRTQWRGIRGGQTGSSFKYGLIFMWWGFLNLLTLFLINPYFSIRLQRFRIENTWFGDRRLDFDGKASELFKPWLIAWVLLFPTLGFSYVWYRVREFRYFASKTRYGSLSFESELSAVSVVLISLGFYVSLVVLIGLLFALVAVFVPGLWTVLASMSDPNSAEMMAQDAAPAIAFLAVMVVYMALVGVMQVVVLIHPLFRVICRTFKVKGREDFAGIAQSRQATPSRGEGLADALDVGAF
jgi:uncharacterized membrane protein YjgN (DUF898 family)